MSNSNNTWFGISMFLIGGIVFYGFAMSSSVPAGSPTPTEKVAADPSPSQPAPAPSADNLPPVDPERDHIRGAENASIYVVEYSDYECPFCARHHPTMAQVVADNDDVAVVYRHFPLSFHPSATPLAEASECVWELGGNDAFWQFTDMVFDKGADAAKITEYATASGVDGAKVQDCVDNGTYSDYVAENMAGGSRAGVSGTPGNVVVNAKTGETRLVSGAQPATAFQAAIDALR